MAQIQTNAAARRRLVFAKMQGVGNDFVVVAMDDIDGIAPDALAIALCERQFGVGADGLLIVGASSDPRAAYSFAMRNPDGTPDMCGNGMRCAALWALKNDLVEADKQFRVETQDGLLACRILSIDEGAVAARVEVQMAVPQLLAHQIPFTGAAPDTRIVDFPLRGLDEPLTVTSVNTGSTHTVAFRDQLPDDTEFFEVSPVVEYLPEFPERTSLIWTREKSPGEYQVRIWERGAGETLGCGTGACAAGVAAIVTGRAQHGDALMIESRGGSVQVTWPSADAPVILTGPAVWVFSGETTFDVPIAEG